MGKRIIIYVDGTGIAGGLKPEQELSNIYKMYRASKIGPDSPVDPEKQISVYIRGIGSTDRESTFFTHPIETINKILGQHIGYGVNTLIVDCYEAILKHYEPGDRVYLFGFSRGGYVVRCVANVMNLCGIPVHDTDGNTVPKFGKALRSIAEEAVYKVYEHGNSKERKVYHAEREEQARRFRKKYGSEGRGKHGEAQGNIQPYFIGVFDTVAALGLNRLQKIFFRLIPAIFDIFAFLAIYMQSSYMILGYMYLLLHGSFCLVIWKNRFRYIKDFPNKGNFKWHFKSWGLKYYDTFLDTLVPYARHAIAIDEERKDFQRVGWGESKEYEEMKDQKPAWLKQVWFSGNHKDIGGSYPEDESRLSDIALQWMIEQNIEIEYPIYFNHKMLNIFPKTDAIQHCEIKALRERLWPKWWPKKYKFSWAKEIRKISPYATLHSSVKERFTYASISDYGKCKSYRPEALFEHHEVKKYYEVPAQYTVEKERTVYFSMPSSTLHHVGNPAS